MLAYPYREHVISKVKYPLMKAIILASKLLEKKLGKITRENVTDPYARTLFDIKERFSQHYYNQTRIELTDSAWGIFLAEIAHDRHYRWLFRWLIIQINDEIKKGNWSLELEEFPDKNCWRSDVIWLVCL